jgi:general L-amino acid transport system permease protein
LSKDNEGQPHGARKEFLMATWEVPIQTRKPPIATGGAMGWLRKNLFSNIPNALISLAMFALIIWVLQGVITWLFTSEGWAAVRANQRLFMVNLYPSNKIWRVELGTWIVFALLGLSGGVWKGTTRLLAIGMAGVLAAATILPILAPPSGINYQIPPLAFIWGGIAIIGVGYFIGNSLGMRLRIPLLIAWLLSFPVITYGLIYGVQPEGVEPLGAVPTNLWGGFLVTVTLTVVGIIASLPIGVLLALGRRSKLPVVRWFCTIYIELVRGVPLVTVFFMAQFLLPLFLPDEIRIDNLLRAMVAVTLFSAAYLAENVRGGLQSLPKGQTEAAQALGLGYAQTTLLITLPQALRAVIPALVGQCISLFKDTSLVSVIGLFDLLQMSKVVQGQTEWLGIPGGVWRETLFFVALIYFIFSFAMSRVSLRVERSLGVGQR